MYILSLTIRLSRVTVYVNTVTDNTTVTCQSICEYCHWQHHCHVSQYICTLMLSLTYSYSTRYQFNNSSFLSLYPVTVHSKCSESPPHTVTAHVTSLTTLHSLVFTQSQFTANAQKVPHIVQRTHGLSHSFTGPGAIANGMTDLKIAFVNCLFASSLNWIYRPHR